MKNWNFEESLMCVLGVLTGVGLLIIGILINNYLHPFLLIPFVILVSVLTHLGMKKHNIG
jgi:hypothetical protein